MKIKKNIWVPAVIVIAVFLALYEVLRRYVITELGTVTDNSIMTVYQAFQKANESVSYLGKNDLSRGIRNNNPGNLRITNIPWKGKIPKTQNTDGAFEQYKTLPYGIRAMLLDIRNDIKKGNNTLPKLMAEYAPAHENHTSIYVDYISKKTGIPKTSKLDTSRETLKKLAWAIMEFENGANEANLYIEDEHVNIALNMI